MQYYVKTQPFGDFNYEPADIGWRSCKDELPPEGVSVPIGIDYNGEVITGYWKVHGEDLTWYSDTGGVEEVDQWFKLPEPLEGEG
jgi:hypothetical protein